MTTEASLNKSNSYDDECGFNILEYTPRKWWKHDVPNTEYIHENVSRHLKSAGLELELGATMLDLRWISARAVTGGVFRVKNDMDILQEVLEEMNVSNGENEPLASVTIISNIISGLGELLSSGIRALNYLLCAELTVLSETNEWMHRYLELMKTVTPEPFLVPSAACYRHPGEDVKYHIDLQVPIENDAAYLTTCFSNCGRYCGVGANNDVAVFSLENLSRLKWLKGHKDIASVATFNANVAKLISGSLDMSVIVWDWKESESPFLVLKGRKGTATSLSLSRDDCKIFSGSLDGTVRIWDIITGHVICKIIFGKPVECVSSCPANEFVTVGTNDGYLRCMSSESRECVFEHNMFDDAAISAVQFGSDGNVLVSGNSLGNATAWCTSTWEQAATFNVPGKLTHISFLQDGKNAILGSSPGEIRHWIVPDQKLSKNNISMDRTVNGLSFLKNGTDIIVGVRKGYACAWSGPISDPNLDFTKFRNSLLCDFDLSADGTRVAAATYDGIIRLWNSHAGTGIAAYSAPVDGSRRLALSADGNKIASSSLNGTILIWNPERPPSDTDVSFKLGEEHAACLSFSPDASRLLVSLKDEVQIRHIETRQKDEQIPSRGSLDTSFSGDGKLIIVGNSERAVLLGCDKNGDYVRLCCLRESNTVFIRRQGCYKDMWVVGSSNVAIFVQDYRCSFLATRKRDISQCGQYFRFCEYLLFAVGYAILSGRVC